MPLVEHQLRRECWSDGSTLILGDGQRWTFPVRDQVPGQAEFTQHTARQALNELIPFSKGEDLRAHASRVASGIRSGDRQSVEAGMLTADKALGLYRAVFRIASRALRHNYRLTEADCERLMPFNYQLAELSDPDSKLNTATPQLLGIFNTVLSVCCVDLGSEFSRIGVSN